MDNRQPSRREFLSLGVAACGALAMQGCAAHAPTAPPTQTGGYIDAHSHVWTPDTRRFPLGPWITPDKMEPASFTAEELLAIARPCSVNRVVLIQHAPYYGGDNSYLIDCAKRYPGTFSIVAIVDERRSDLAGHLQTLRKQGVRGLRIGPNRYADRTLVKEPEQWLKAADMRRLWTLATEQKLVLCPLINAPFIPTLEPMLAEFSQVDVALDHFAHAQTAEELKSLLKLSRFPRVSVKASGFYKFGDTRAPYDDLEPMIRTVVDAFGPGRVLWGSDCPYQLQNGNNYPQAVSLMEKGLSFLNSSARDAILRRNAQRLFFAS